VSDRFVGVVLFNRRLTIAGKKMGEKNPRKHISAENQKNHNHLINKGYLTYQVFTTSSGDAFV
jgi:hypothetical protein